MFFVTSSIASSSSVVVSRVSRLVCCRLAHQLHPSHRVNNQYLKKNKFQWKFEQIIKKKLEEETMYPVE
jgi:hypothetical protein